MVAHDTGNPGSTAASNVSYYEHSRNEMEASAHIFVDDKEIIECIPFLTATPEKAWHVRYNPPIDNQLYGCDANDAAGGVELCYGGSIDLPEAYKRYIWVLAYSCYKYGLDPAQHITGHYKLDPQQKVDPINAFNLLGKAFNEFVEDIINEYNNCLVADITPAMALDAGYANTIIQTWMVPAWGHADLKRLDAETIGDLDASTAWKQQADYIHLLANELRKASGQPEE
ncbi:peptidoglycan recognition protein family protein [Paenibacillus foliorum]|nr:peptidoglycan recognition family protein [Paenibacillus foliorum]